MKKLLLTVAVLGIALAAAPLVSAQEAIFKGFTEGHLVKVGADGIAADATPGTDYNVPPAAGAIGYKAGDGGAVTQLTNRTTGVTLNKRTGQITTNNASLAAGASATFTVTNSTVGASDVIVPSIKSGATTNATAVRITGVAAGSFDVTVTNGHASTAETGAIVFNFAVIKGSSS